MRRVWGWTPASSAATEMTKTARSLGRCARSAIFLPRHFGQSFHAEVRPRRIVGQGRELAQQLTLLARELLRHRDLHGDQQVAAGATPGARHAAAPHPEGAAVLRACG